MHQVLSLAILGLALVCQFVSAEEASEVLVLNEANFDQAVKDHAPIMVEFYAPWCGHCQSLEPAYEEAARMLKEQDSPARLAKVDATADDAKALLKRFKIMGFPTLKFFKTYDPEDEGVKYTGGREAKEIAGWVNRKSGVTYKTIESEEGAREVLSRSLGAEEQIVIGTFPLAEQMAAFASLSDKDADRQYFASVGAVPGAWKTLAASLDSPSVIVLRGCNVSHPASTAEASVVSDVARLRAYLDEASKPVLHSQEYTDEDVARAKQSGLHLVEFFAPWCGFCKEFAPKYDQVAVHYNDLGGDVVVATLDGTKYEKTMESEGVESFPTVKLYRDGASAFYSGENEKQDLIDWVEAKRVARAQVVTDVASFVKLPAGEGAQALVVCMAENDDASLDTLAFEFSSPTFKVGKLAQCSEPGATLYGVSGEIAHTSLVTGKKFRKWVKQAAVPRLFAFNDDAFDQVMAAEFKWLFMYFAKEETTPELVVSTLEQAVNTHGKFDDVAFAHITPDKDYLLEYFGIKEDDLPVVRAIDLIQGDLPSYNGELPLTVAGLEKLHDDVLNKRLEKAYEPGEEYDGYPDDEEGDEPEEDDDEDEEEDYDDEDKDEL